MSTRATSETFKFAITTVVTVGLAFSGYIYSQFAEIEQFERDARFKREIKLLEAELDRTDRQLRELYGPLYALVALEQEAFGPFVRHARGPSTRSYFSASNPPSKAEEGLWRLWNDTVDFPNYLKMEKIILSHADLLIEDEFPKPLGELLAHIAGYKLTRARWAAKDFSVHLSFFNYPTSVRQYAKDSYEALKTRQAQLLREVQYGKEKGNAF